MLTNHLHARLLAGILLPLLISAALAADADADGLVVQLKDLPANVQHAIQTQVGEGTVDEITKAVDEGETTYDVDMTKKGRERSFTLSDQGELLEEEIFIGETPMPVRKAIHAHVGKGTINDIEKVHDAGEITYDVEMTKDGATRDFTLNAKGELVEIQMFMTELPAPAQATMKRWSGAGTVGDIYKCIDDGDVSYEVDVETNGKSRTLTFDTDGAFMSEEQDVTLADAPEAVQKSVGGQLAGAKLAGLTQVTEDGTVTFEAEWLKDGKSRYATFAVDGKMLPPDEN